MTLEYDYKIQKEPWSQSWIKKGLERYESLIANHSGKYSVGDEVTLADCFLFSILHFCTNHKIDLNSYERIKAIGAALN
jgi:glutathione S-transferase